MSTRTTIPVFFSSDDNYVPFLAVSITSLIRNASLNYDYNIIILYNNISASNLEKLHALGKEGFTITTIPMNTKMQELTKTGTENLCTNYYSLSIYFRIFISVMFPEYDRGIYLDSDITVIGDISELYNISLNNNIIGAVVDQSVQNVPVFINYIEKSLGIPVKNYVNSGILLMDLQKLRELNFCSRFLEVLNKYHFETVAPDQDYINVLCKDKIEYLPANWNTMSSNDVKNIKNPKIIHFNLFGKPWRYNNIPYEELFWEYAQISTFYEEIKTVKETYPQKKREVAKKYLQGMFDKAERLITAEHTFSHYFDSGIEKRI